MKGPVEPSSDQDTQARVVSLRGRRSLTRASAVGVVTAVLWTISVWAGGDATPASVSGAILGQVVPLSVPSTLVPPSATSTRKAAPIAKSGPSISCNGGVEQTAILNIPLGQSTTFSVDDAIRMRTVGNPHVVQTIQTGPKQLYVVGTSIGSTNMVIQERGGACTAVSVTVTADPTGLQQTIATLMPDEKDVHVSAAADAIVLSGRVSDAVEAQRIVELAQRFVMTANPPVSNEPAVGKDAGGAAASAGAEQARARVINMLAVASPQQVMLEVKVAEVSKKLIDDLGLTVQLKSTHMAASIGKLLAFGATQDFVNLNANKSEEPVKILAEPNLMAISGQKASFLAGGKVFFPIPQSLGMGGVSMVTLQEETYGVKLTFMPTVLKNDIINLQVSPEVSELASTGLSFKYGNDGMYQPVPAIEVRSASTTVQLKDGQSFAIGGLLKDNVRGELEAFPGLGELPIIGALFRSTHFQSDKTELIFIVTPHLVKPLPTAYPLPTDTFGKVDSWTVRATGNMEGAPSKSEPPRGEELGMGAVPPLSDSSATEQPAQSGTQKAPDRSDGQGEVPAVQPRNGIIAEPRVTEGVTAPPAQ